MNCVIETRHLGKHFGKVVAVHDLNLNVAEGEIYAFLGLNGAGKTTSIRMLLGMIKPTAGSARILQTEIKMGSRRPWAEVGYLVEIPYAYPELTVEENLEISRRLHPGTTPEALTRIIEKLRLSEYAQRRAGTLSQGNAQRLGLAKALLHSPRLLLLDEPANGLDPAGIVEIRELLLDLSHNHGVTIFMSSHILAEVSLLADRIGIIHQGHLIQELDKVSLEKNRRKKLVVKTRNAENTLAVLNACGLHATPKSDGFFESVQP
jgi:ABC-2 type transport system ATP-binding protein